MMANPLLRSVYADSVFVIRLKDGDKISYFAAVDSRWATPLLTNGDVVYLQKRRLSPAKRIGLAKQPIP